MKCLDIPKLFSECVESKALRKVLRLDMRRKSRSIAASARLIGLAIFLLVAGTVRGAEGGKRPNIIFILADDLGYGDVGFEPFAQTNALARLRTAHLERLAAGGVVLTAHYAAAPVSAPSRASLITGRAQGCCSLRDNCFDRPFAETNTLATVLHGVGYATWAVGKWGVAGGGESGLPVTSHPLDRGFDYFYGFLDHLAGHTYYHYEGYLNGAFMGITENRTNATASAHGIYSTDLFTAKAKQLIEAHVKSRSASPFFLYLALNAVHGSGRDGGNLITRDPLHVPGRPYPAGGVRWPLEPEEPESRNTWIDPEYRGLGASAARYATTISRLDDAIGDLMQTLDDMGIADNTLVVFTSDNGPADEYGANPDDFRSAGPFDGLKRDVFEGGMRVPAVVRWPRAIPAGMRDDAPSQFHDWMATFAAAADAVPPPECDGVSLLPRWTGGVAKPSLVYTQYEFPYDGASGTYLRFKARKGRVRGLQQMVREGDFVALRTRIREDGPKTRLYNVRTDPFQTEDLAARPECAAILKRLTGILDGRYRP